MRGFSNASLINQGDPRFFERVKTTHADADGWLSLTPERLSHLWWWWLILFILASKQNAHGHLSTWVKDYCRPEDNWRPRTYHCPHHWFSMGLGKFSRGNSKYTHTLGTNCRFTQSGFEISDLPSSIIKYQRVNIVSPSLSPLASHIHQINPFLHPCSILMITMESELSELCLDIDFENLNSLKHVYRL